MVVVLNSILNSLSVPFLDSRRCNRVKVIGWFSLLLGVNCQVLVDYCAHVTCQNGAVCNNVAGDAQCVCVAGFTGRSESLMYPIEVSVFGDKWTSLVC